MNSNAKWIIIDFFQWHSLKKVVFSYLSKVKRWVLIAGTMD